MSTIMELIEQGVLVGLGGGLAPDEVPSGRVAAYPHVIQWFENVLPNLEPVLDEGKQSPLEQVDELIYDFVAGKDLSYYERSHSMTPHEAGVWELKTPDVRLFGWFKTRRAFIAADVNSAFLIKQHGLYQGYLGNVIRQRLALGLDEPKFILGGYSDVL